MPTYDKRLPNGELVKVEEERDYDGTGFTKTHRADGSVDTNITPKTAHFEASVKPFNPEER